MPQDCGTLLINTTSHQPGPSLDRVVRPASAAVTGLRLYEILKLLFEQVLWDSISIPSQKDCLIALSAVIHCCHTGVVTRCGERGVFYNLLIKLQSFSGPVSWNCDLHKCVF